MSSLFRCRFELCVDRPRSSSWIPAASWQVKVQVTQHCVPPVGGILPMQIRPIVMGTGAEMETDAVMKTGAVMENRCCDGNRC
ncbi:hypothetical protein BDV12DRAFT_172162 [Aspergillus spectabilis]